MVCDMQYQVAGEQVCQRFWLGRTAMLSAVCCLIFSFFIERTKHSSIFLSIGNLDIDIDRWRGSSLGIETNLWIGFF